MIVYAKTAQQSNVRFVGPSKSLLSIISSVSFLVSLASFLRFLLTFYTRFIVVLSFSSFSQSTSFRYGTFESTKSIIKRLTISDICFSQRSSLPSSFQGVPIFESSSLLVFPYPQSNAAFGFLFSTQSHKLNSS